MKCLNINHHCFIYELYKNNPSMPLSGYCEEFFIRFGIKLSDVFIKRWFDTIGPFKGSLRVTSSHNISRYSDENIRRLQNYLNIIANIDDHVRLVFSDEKPMKEVMIFPKVRRDPLFGDSPKNKSTSNSKNRYNILAAVNVKGGQVPPVYFRVLEATTQTRQYIASLLKNWLMLVFLEEAIFLYLTIVLYIHRETTLDWRKLFGICIKLPC